MRQDPVRLKMVECSEGAKAYVISHEMGTTIVVAGDFGEMFLIFRKWWRTCDECQNDSDDEIVRLVFNIQLLDDGPVLVADHLLGGPGRE